VLDHDGGPELRLRDLRDEPRRHVGRAARPERHDELDGAAWVVLRLHGADAGESGQRTDAQRSSQVRDHASPSTPQKPSRFITRSSVTRSRSGSSEASWKCGRQAGAAITSPRFQSKRSPSIVVAPLPRTTAKMLLAVVRWVAVRFPAASRIM